MLPEAIGAAETPSHLPIADAMGPLLSPRGEEKRHAVAKCDCPAQGGRGRLRAIEDFPLPLDRRAIAFDRRADIPSPHRGDTLRQTVTRARAEGVVERGWHE